ncbi:MAG: trypsin-like peptidase domain-containing protein, partial [Actinobacteria bacterium]|nr:trypsin-like peptidase domain-containing protein [Actinomycetota bacterium]
MNKKVLKILGFFLVFTLLSVLSLTGCFSKAIERAAESMIAESMAEESAALPAETSSSVQETSAVPAETAAQYELTGKDLIILAQPAVCFVVCYYSAYVYDPNQNDYFGPYYSYIYYGTGFCINPNTGHIMTAGHVVDIPEVEVKWKILEDHVWEVYGEDEYYSLTNEDWNWIYNNYKVVGETSDTYMDHEVWVQFNTATSGLADSANAQYMRAEIIDSSPSEQRDIALIRIQSISGGALSSVLVADSSMMEIQDDVTIIGYPGTSDMGQDNILNPTVTTGRVSGKIMLGGTEVLQIQGDARSGNSGGPVLNPNGMVIGMLTMGTDETNNYLRPSSDLKLMINKNGVENT